MNGKAAVVGVAALALVMAVLVVSQTSRNAARSSTAVTESSTLAGNDSPFDFHGKTDLPDFKTSTITDPTLPLRVVRPGEWGFGCNDALLAGPFSLEHAPDFNVSQSDFKRITEVIDELKRGYGGTLVTAPPDPALDSSAFLAHYLRAFGNPVNMPSYDYHFERILSRLDGAETVLDDDRLDWDIWRAYLLFENAVAGSDDGNTFKTVEHGETFINNLDSAKDLLWGYLDRNAERIRKDKDRLRWWIDSVTTDLEERGGRPMRRWFLLQLVASSDTKTAALLDDQKHYFLIEPDPFNPFIILGSDDLFVEKKVEAQPAFLKAIEQIAASQKLSYEIWGIDPATMAPTKAVDTDLAPRRTQISFAKVLSQESWSENSDSFGVGFCRPIGRRAAYYNLRMPTSDRKDGVFFFTFNARLYVWPKSKMDTAAIQLLHVSQLIDDATYARFRAEGFDSLPITAASDRQ